MRLNTYGEVELYTEVLIKKIKELTPAPDFVVGISRGGLIPAVIIATSLNLPLVCAYIDKQDNVYLDRAEWLKDKNVLIVDDATRTGLTLSKIQELVDAAGASYSFAAVLAKLDKATLLDKTLPEPIAVVHSNEDVLFPWD